MSTKKQLREEAAQVDAQMTQGASGIQVAYLIVCALLLVGFVIASKSALFLARNASNSKGIAANIKSYEAWPENIVEEFSNLRVQNGGRIKPALTFARFALLQINNSATARFETQDGKKHSISAEEWLLDTLFRGDMARDMPIFNVDDTDAVDAIGVPPKEGNKHHRKRDRYSYNQLAVARPRLAEESQKISEKQSADPDYQLNRMEGITQRLAQNVSFFEFMEGQFGFARKGEGLAGSAVLPNEMKAMAQGFDVIGFFDHMPEMAMQDLFQLIGRPAQSEDEMAVQAAFRLFFFYANSGRNLSLFPPDNSADDEWLGVGDMMVKGMESKGEREFVKGKLNQIASLNQAQKEMWAAIEALPEDAGKDAKIDAAKPVAEKFGAFVEEQRTTAKDRLVAKRDAIDAEIAAADESLEKERLQDKRGLLKLEGAKAEKEVKLYTAGYFKKSLVYFILGFVLLAVSWLAPGSKFSKIFGWLALASLIYALFMNAYGITMRSIIRSRPPITNLYDTVIFITGSVVFLALLLEYFTRKGIGTLMAALAGVLGMFLSIRYEVKEATDTMDPLQAVLDTNFWLATHVTAINIGYAAGMLAAFLGAFYLLRRFLKPLPKVLRGISGSEQVNGAEIFEVDKAERDTQRLITNMTYGIVCFALFFSLVGTVLGGVWANYSWGRFWGWDPKENGAFMICLWTLVILHMRMGGYVKEIGIAVLSVILGVIVTFSWWGVNNLGVGLHSYGFTDGVMQALYITWGEAVFIMLCGFPLWLHERMKKRGKELIRAQKKARAAGGEPLTA